MLIYNFQKEFLGIDDSDLTKMGFQNLSQLRAEAADFADLFVKTPGFIHNFKHVHWIDFVECAESDDSSNVIIRANNKNFQCNIEIQTVFLVDAPTQKAYLVFLNNLRELSKSANEQIANDIYEKPTPVAATFETTKLQTVKSSHEFEPPTEEMPTKEIPPVEASYDPYEQERSDEPIDILDTPPSYLQETQIEEKIEMPLDDEKQIIDEFADDDFKLDIDVEDTQEPIVKEPELELEPELAPQTTTPSVENSDADLDGGYVYNPSVASSELGLPLDLIEEFIEDFIAQAHEFKDELYVAHNNGDTDKVKVLSHKLKGVAANLRIEDAFEVLATINTSDDHDTISTNLNRLYIIIAKLAGEDVQPQAAATTQKVQNTTNEQSIDEDHFSIDFEENDYQNETVDEIVDEKIELVNDYSQEEDDIFLDFKDDEDSSQNNLDVKYSKTASAEDIGIDLDSFNELFSDFLNESKLLSKKINNSIERKDVEMWRKDSVKLKGMSENMRVNSFKGDLDTLIHTADINVATEALGNIQTSLEKISNL
jgi:HPt (histidine-containing phosphotransfer) domain-containing protein